MIKLGDIREDIKSFKDFEIIFDLSETGCKRFEQEYTTIEELLNLPDDYEIPYECYEIVRDWDDYGLSDGKDAICFYTHRPGFLETHERAAYVYSYI